MAKILIIFLGFLFLAPILPAQSLPTGSLGRDGDTTRVFKKYESPFLQLVMPGSIYDQEAENHYPFWAKPLLSELLKYNPVTEMVPESKECDLTEMKSIPSYIARCEKQIETGLNDFFSNAYLTMMLKLKPESYPYGRIVILNLANGVKLKGLLALKGDDKKRPLVIIRTGIFSNVTRFLPERYLFLQLFEQSAFNVLVLESTSGSEFILRNQDFVLGGYDEGIQNYQVAKALKNPNEPLSKIIDSIHLVGASLGGHGVLFASLLNEINPRVISSTLAFCPLVNYRDTLDYHLSQGLVAKAINYWAAHRLKGVEKTFPQINMSKFLTSLMFYLDTSYGGAKALDSTVQLPKEMQVTPKNYWIQNNYWPYFKNVKTPVLIFATKTDPIVPYALNSERLAQKSMDIGTSNLQVIPLSEGFHCSLPGAYQWKPMATFFQQYILSQTSFHRQSELRRLVLNPASVGQIQKFGFHPHASVQIINQKLYLRVEFLEKPVSYMSLIKNLISKAKVPSLDFAFEPKDIGYGIMESMVDTKIYERWFQQNLRYTILDLNGTKPTLQLEWLH